MHRFIRADERWLEFEVWRCCPGTCTISVHCILAVFAIPGALVVVPCAAACCSAFASCGVPRLLASDTTRPKMTCVQVVMEGQATPVWLHRKQLKACDSLLRAFVRRLRE